MGPPTTAPASMSIYLYNMVWLGSILYGIGFFANWAYRIRMMAIEEYGPVIHEFDPYFNYRATEYLYHNGWQRFVTWFDYMSWYPLGRPVGTTIYPGMQVSAVFIKNYIMGDKMSVNDVCCYIPTWFGVTASMFTGLLAYECSIPQSANTNVITVVLDIFRSKKQANTKVTGTGYAVEIGVFAMGIMAVVPAHLMRSVGGGYDNESVAVTALTSTFFFWVRSLRANDDKSWYFGIMTGLAYFNMVAAWGGYIFVINLIGCHAVLLVLMGRFSTKVYRAYSLFYLIGTALAIQVPVVGLSPLKSLEQLGPCAVFLAYQVLQFCNYMKRKRNLSTMQTWLLRVQVTLSCLIVGGALIYFFVPGGYFGPLSSRVRGLFVKHTKTGNPLVDSVAEHQPASKEAYFQYLHNLYYIAPVGFLMVLLNFGDAPSFLILYGCVSYFFSAKMVRLILLLAPIASALSGIVVGSIYAWSLQQFSILKWILSLTEEAAEEESTTKGANGKKKKKTPVEKEKLTGIAKIKASVTKMTNSSEWGLVKKMVAVLLLAGMVSLGYSFKDYSWAIAASLSNPNIIIKGTTRSGKTVLVDDYREAYWWLRDNTPEDSRVLAWWDYGYQIAGIANRTTLADGNTWNHEHIALLGKILTTDVDEGYEIARHLADYALVWAGGGGDDLAKSPHLARIANSVYRDHCPRDPTCRAFGFMDSQGTPTPMMERSFLYKLHSSGIRPGVEADPSKFKEVFRTQYGKVRIFKILGTSRASKSWVANPENRICDVEGGWYCRGQYPPALKTILSKKKDFAQLEDFNRKEKDDEYQKQYFENLNDPRKASRAASKQSKQINQESKKSSSEKEAGSILKHDPKTKNAKLEALAEKFKQWKTNVDMKEAKDIYDSYRNTDETTLMWDIVTNNKVDAFLDWIFSDPMVAFLRSDDGRGPMWWAYEARSMEIAYILMKIGIGNTDMDINGVSPLDLLPKN